MNEKQIDPKTSYPLVDVIKFLCAFLVVAIHVNPFYSYQSGITKALYFGIRQYVARIAVPFYFAAAGFFLFRKIDLQDIDMFVIRTYVFKVLRLYAIWSILLLVDDAYHLWYMSSLAVAIVFLSVLFKKKVSLNKIIVLSVFLYGIGLLGDSYYGVSLGLKKIGMIGNVITAYEQTYGSTRNGIFMGAPFVLIGVLFAQKRISIKQSVAIGGFLVSLALMFVEICLLRILGSPQNFNMFIMLVPTTIFLFGVATSVRSKPCRLCGRLRVVGTLIYYDHLFINRLVAWGFRTFRGYFGANTSNSIAVFMLTIVLSTAVGFGIEWLSHKEKFTYLKWLYM